MFSVSPGHDRLAAPLDDDESRRFLTLVRTETRDDHRVAVSRHVAHLTPSQCRFLATMTIGHIWRNTSGLPA